MVTIPHRKGILTLQCRERELVLDQVRSIVHIEECLSLSSRSVFETSRVRGQWRHQGQILTEAGVREKENRFCANLGSVMLSLIRRGKEGSIPPLQA